MNEEQVKILGKLKSDSLTLIKEEAEYFLEGQTDSENIIIGKASNLFQILIALFISILGYLITESDSTERLELYNSGVLFEIFLSISIVCTFITIFPRKTRLKGAPPKNILNPDIFSGSEHDVDKFLKNRIYCLNNDIGKNEKSQRIRNISYKLSMGFLLLGIFIVSLNFFL